MSSDQARVQFDKVPFGTCCFNDIMRINIHLVKMIDSSFIRDMLRSRWVFSITFAASATFDRWCPM